MRTRHFCLSLLLLIACAGAFMPSGHAAPLHADAVIDHIVVEKSKREMAVYAGGKKLKTYRIALGQSPVGAKAVEGDMKTPEGRYTINDKNARSQYHKNLGISYPEARDRARAKQLGMPPGGAIKIHGLPNGGINVGSLHRLRDWTWGCIAVTNAEVDELFRAVPVGTPIEIKP